MPGVLFKIPLTKWIRETIDKMINNGKSDIQSWSYYWFETYKELGGRSKESGTKGCPQHAAYGLWRLGRIKGANIPYQEKSIHPINQEFGKNAAYAVLALDLFEAQKAARDNTALWIQVQEQYRKAVHEEPAKSQQGAITVAAILFEEGQIVTEHV
jgi:hypothetical protein